MITKQSKAIKAYRDGDLKGALSLAKTFKLGLTPDERKALLGGWEALVRPDFQRQLKRDPEAQIMAATVVMGRMSDGYPHAV